MKKKSTSKLRNKFASTGKHSVSAPAHSVVPRLRDEGGFFNLRVLIGLFLFLAGVFLALLGFGTFSNASAQQNQSSATQAQGQKSRAYQIGQMTVIPASRSDLSRPLREQPLE